MVLTTSPAPQSFPRHPTPPLAPSGPKGRQTRKRVNPPTDPLGTRHQLQTSLSGSILARITSAFSARDVQSRSMHDSECGQRLRNFSGFDNNCCAGASQYFLTTIFAARRWKGRASLDGSCKYIRIQRSSSCPRAKNIAQSTCLSVYSQAAARMPRLPFPPTPPASRPPPPPPTHSSPPSHLPFRRHHPPPCPLVLLRCLLLRVRLLPIVATELWQPVIGARRSLCAPT